MASPAFHGTPSPPPALPVSTSNSSASGSFLSQAGSGGSVADDEHDDNFDEEDGAAVDQQFEDMVVEMILQHVPALQPPPPVPPAPLVVGNDTDSGNSSPENAVVPPNSLNAPHPMNYMAATLSRTWTSMHCGELIQDPRLPVYSQFNRLASFRFCPISAGRKMELSDKGWYCSSVSHELRCAFCWRQMGPCHAVATNTLAILTAQHHRCDGRMSQHDYDNQHTLNVGFPALVDPLQDRLVYCMSAPDCTRRDMSSYKARVDSFCNPYWPTRLWGLASPLAVAGFFFKRKCVFPFSLTSHQLPGCRNPLVMVGILLVCHGYCIS